MRVAFLLILTLSFLHICAAEREKYPSAMVVGTVYCDTCFRQQFSKESYFISGASVEVECGDSRLDASFRVEVKTDRHGEFRVRLPFTVGKHIKKIKKCSVKVVGSSESYCAVASMATSSLLHLRSIKEGIHVFSAGFFTFKPLRQPELCFEEPSPEASPSASVKAFLPYPDVPDLNQNPPPVLNLPPLPQIPRIPPLPTLPIPTPPTNLGKPDVSSSAMQASEPAHPTFWLDPKRPTIGIPFPPGHQKQQPQPPAPPRPFQLPPKFSKPAPIPTIAPPEPALPVPFPPVLPVPLPPVLPVPLPPFPPVIPASKSKETFP